MALVLVAPVRVEHGEPRGYVVDGKLHAERIEPEVGVFQSVAVIVMLVLAFGGEGFDGFYCVLGLHLAALDLADYFEHHGGKILVLVVLTLLVLVVVLILVTVFALVVVLILVTVFALVVVLTLVTVFALVVVLTLLVLVAFLTLVVLAHLSFFEGLDELLELFQAGLRADLAFLHLVYDVADLFQQFDLFGVAFTELYGVDQLTHLDDRRWVPGGVFQEIMEPGAFQAQSDANHEVGVGDPGHVLGAWLEGVRVGSHR